MAVAGSRILVVEDEPLIAMMIEDMLIDLGAECVGPAATLKRAFEMIGSEAVDAAILDINLPDGNSDALAARMRADGVAVILSSGSQPGAGEAANGGGWLPKPFTFGDLERALEAALGTS